MFEKIDLPKLLNRYKIPGIALSLIEDYKISAIKTHGYSNVEKEKPITENTVFQLASISKSISAWGVMKLVEKGLINLDAPAEKYLTRWHFPPSEFDNGDITTKRLLSHTGGLSLHGYSGYVPSYEIPSIEDSLSGNFEYQKDEIQLKMRKLFKIDSKVDEKSVEVVKRPGTEFSYSGGGYSVLQLIVEEVAGKMFAEYMEKEVLQPLGMGHSSFTWRKDLQPLTATAYVLDGKSAPNYLFTALAAAGCYSTINDLSAFVLAGMKGFNTELPGRGILKPETLQLMYTKVLETNEMTLSHSDTGLGHFIMYFDGIKVVHHSGGNIGWNTLMSFIPETGDGLVILTNGQNGLRLTLKLSAKWQKYVEKKMNN